MEGNGGGNGHPHSHFPWYTTSEGKPAGLRGFLTSTNHKRIGTLYLVPILSFFTVAVILGVLMRIQMLSPNSKFLTGTLYNQVFTLHGVIMVFLVVIPAIPTIFGNFFLPILIGGKDMAFPRLNLFTWYLYILGAVILLVSLLTGKGPADTGWTFYVPYSLRTTVNVPFAVFGVFILGMSSILTGLEHRHHRPHGARPGDEVLPACPFPSGASTPPRGSRSWRPRSSASRWS